MGTYFLYVNIGVFLIKERNFVKHRSERHGQNLSKRDTHDTVLIALQCDILQLTAGLLGARAI